MKIELLSLIVTITPFITYSQVSEWYCQDQEQTKTEWVETNLGKQKILIATPAEINEATNLIIYLHGDAPFDDPVDQYFIARDISAYKNYISVAVLRPGYEDGCGSGSEGIRGRTMGDNYTQEVIESVSKIVKSMKARFNPNQLILMGHSGGGALSTLFLSLYPGLVDKALIFSCPCDLAVWRKHMYDRQQDQRWLETMPGLSPLAYVNDLDPQVPITFIVGANDEITPPSMTRAFVSAADQLGKNVSFETWEGHDHMSVLYREGFRRMLQLLD